MQAKHSCSDAEHKQQLDKLVTYNTDALALLGHTHIELLSRRRELIKPNLNNEYVSLCSPQTPITELLFGDDLQARMASIKAANKISQNTTSSSKFATNMRRPFEKLEFSKQPYQLHVARDKSKFDACWDPDQAHTCEVEVQNLLHKGAIVLCEHEKGEYISPIYTTLKKDGSSRMILNLKGLNQFIEYCHFRMESFSTIVNMVKPNCFMASIDLIIQCLYIATEHQKYLKFMWEGKLYKFVCFQWPGILPQEIY